MDFGEEPDIRTARRIRFREPQVPSETFSAILQKFWNENEETWSHATKHDYRTCQRILLQIVGDVPISAIDSQTMREYKEKVAKLPKFLNRKRYQGKSIDDILSMGITDTISRKTANKYIG